MDDKPSITARNAALAALHAAASKATKPGATSSELWLSLLGIAVTTAATVAGGPVIGGIVALGVGSAVATYNASRGSVKKALGSAAIAALGGIAQAAPGPLGDAATVAETVIATATK